MIVDDRRHRHEDTLVLEPCHAIDDRAQRDPNGTRAEGRLYYESERGDGSRTDRGFVLDGDAVRRRPADVHPERAERRAIPVDSERDLTPGEAPGPGLRARVAEEKRDLRR